MPARGLPAGLVTVDVAGDKWLRWLRLPMPAVLVGATVVAVIVRTLIA